ncbi:MAG: ATP-binding protein [bacterium]
MTREFKRDIESLDEIFVFLDDFIAKNRIDESISFTVNLVVEELFTNMVKYNPGSAHDVLIEISRNENRLIVSLTDFDVEPFDITKTEEVKIDQHLQERKVGGLGIHLVKQMVDKIEYEYKNRNSKITLIKHLEK